MVARDGVVKTAEQRLKALGIRLPTPPKPFGTYVEAVGNLLFLSGMLRCPPKDAGQESLGALAQSLPLRRDARRPASRHSMC